MFDDAFGVDVSSEVTPYDTSPLRGIQGIKKLSSLNQSEKRAAEDEEIKFRGRVSKKLGSNEESPSKKFSMDTLDNKNGRILASSINENQPLIKNTTQKYNMRAPLPGKFGRKNKEFLNNSDHIDFQKQQSNASHVIKNQKPYFSGGSSFIQKGKKIEHQRLFSANNRPQTINQQVYTYGGSHQNQKSSPHLNPMQKQMFQKAYQDYQSQKSFGNPNSSYLRLDTQQSKFGFNADEELTYAKFVKSLSQFDKNQMMEILESVLADASDLQVQLNQDRAKTKKRSYLFLNQQS